MESSMRSRDTPLDDCEDNECKLPRKHEGLCDRQATIFIDYTNWKGDRRKRRVAPTGQVTYEANEWHKLPQWLFEAIDCEDGKQKKFSVKDVHSSKGLLFDAIRVRWTSG